MKAYLIYQSRILPVEGEKITLGRKLENDIVLSSNRVSRQHAEISFEKEAYFLRDLESSSGTFVNGQRITFPTRLRSGDTLSLADIEIEFILREEDLEIATKKRTTRLNVSDPDEKTETGQN